MMENSSQKKKKVANIQREEHDTNRVKWRPKNFSLGRRREMYYFSDDSENGILKRVPFKNGTYKYNELKTLLEEPDSEKNRNENWSDVPLNSPGGLKADTSKITATNEDSYEAIHHEEKNENVLKSPDETAGLELLSHGLKNFAMIKDYQEDLNHKNDGQKQLRGSNQGQTEDSFNKSFQRPKKKKYKTNVLVPTHCEKSKNSDEKFENISASNMSSSSSKSEESEDKPLNADELNMMQMKTPVTEL